MVERKRLKRRSQVEAPAQVALVQVDIAHHHDVAGVAQDPAQPFHLPAIAQIAGRKGVPEAIGVDWKADPVANPAQEVGHAHQADPAAVGLWRGKSSSSSSGTRVDMVEPAENGPGDDAATATPLTRERTGQRQGAVLPIVVVVVQEFG